MARTIEESNGKAVAYDSVFVEPSKLNVFNSDLSFKVIREIAKQPVCAMDIARNIRQHEQKIYYHLRKFERAGIIRIVRTEKRHSMTAKLYGLVAPVVAAKLHEDGMEIKSDFAAHYNPEVRRFLHPFIDNGRLDAKIIIGDSYSHGKYDAHSTEGPHIFDFAVMVGGFLSELSFPHYKLDTEISKNELKENLILFGNNKTNAVIEEINHHLPAYFDPARDCIISKATKKAYENPRTGFVIKCDNPLNKEKKILIFGGVRTRGIQSAIIAVTKHSDKLLKNADHDGNICRIVEGFDEDSDKIIDTVRFLE